MSMASGMNARESSMAKMPKKPAKELDHIRVAEAENGGHTAYHHHTAEYEHPPEGPHIFPAQAEPEQVQEGGLMHHLAKHLSIPHEVISGEKEAKAEAEPAEGEEVEA
jgi:hypothetical protein